MKKETLDKLQISLIVLATAVVIVMNVFTFNPVTFNVLRALLASCWIGVIILPWVTRMMKNSQD